MSLPTDPADQSEQYSIVLASQSYADSPADALQMFFAQMVTGHVQVEIHNADTNESWELDALEDESREAQVDLALGLIARHTHGLSNHDKVDIINRINTILGMKTASA